MKHAAPRKWWERVQTPSPLRGCPVVQKTPSTGKFKDVLGRRVRQEFLGWRGVHFDGKYHQVFYQARRTMPVSGNSAQ